MTVYMQLECMKDTNEMKTFIFVFTEFKLYIRIMPLIIFNVTFMTKYVELLN